MKECMKVEEVPLIATLTCARKRKLHAGYFLLVDYAKKGGEIEERKMEILTAAAADSAMILRH